MVRTASGMEAKGSPSKHEAPSKDEDQWRKTFMGMHQKMHACIQELTTQVQGLQQNAIMQNKSMESIEEALVSLTAQLSALPSAIDVPCRLQRSGVRMHEGPCPPSIPKTTKAPQHRLCMCAFVCARIMDSGVLHFFTDTQIAGLKRQEARKALTLR